MFSVLSYYVNRVKGHELQTNNDAEDIEFIQPYMVPSTPEIKVQGFQETLRALTKEDYFSDPSFAKTPVSTEKVITSDTEEKVIISETEIAVHFNAPIIQGQTPIATEVSSQPLSAADKPDTVGTETTTKPELASQPLEAQPSSATAVSSQPLSAADKPETVTIETTTKSELASQPLEAQPSSATAVSPQPIHPSQEQKQPFEDINKASAPSNTTDTKAITPTAAATTSAPPSLPQPNNIDSPSNTFAARVAQTQSHTDTHRFNLHEILMKSAAIQAIVKQGREAAARGEGVLPSI
ncbi:hypothetical protein [Rickettsiales endosymbiont of Stachyamoeba lipophora]|uniref:hypothetical protein n=1 Tax=Rickettsiales endosymbiont of Stachyamoeba lipophora TaxID=2486578 RepID=UPI000F64646D|nr:hypothetical protein [Rickettsiales endosymbiont of Stachyamoeba lipophora]AZL15701.1 hypothetical protein EF513_03945 [Rickettsiales endosymbiont of Stachyamoeba lipophora]